MEDIKHNPAGEGSLDPIVNGQSSKASKKNLSSSNDAKKNKHEKLNGEIDIVDKEFKRSNLATVSNRARSRSKSPRGKSPEGRDVGKNLDKKETKKETVSKTAVKKERSPSKGVHIEKQDIVDSAGKTSPNKKRSPKASGLVSKVKEKLKNAKQAIKRKVKTEVAETSCTQDNNEGNIENEPIPKKSKTDEAVVKPKRKYAKKGKKDECCSKSEQGKKPTKNCFNSGVHDDEYDEEETGKIPNGFLSQKESLSLSSGSVSNAKKGTHKKNAKSEKLLHPTLPVTAKSSLPLGETEDSDTMDYSVNNGNNNFTDNLVEKKVVKIDDIEITELSDLNSSRESGDEAEAASRCLVEKPQALNDSLSSPKSEAATGLISTTNPENDTDKVYSCEKEGCKYKGKSKVLLRKHLTHHNIYYCAHCEFLGHQYEELELHMVSNHPQRWGRKKCKKCGRYIKRDEFDTHDETCSGKKIFNCEICGKEFKYESLAKDHEKKVHKSHNCQFCEFIGDTKQILSHHMSQVHPKKKPDKHKCKDCEHMFPTKKLLSQHYKNEHKTNVTDMENESISTSIGPPTLTQENTSNDIQGRETQSNSISNQLNTSFTENTDSSATHGLNDYSANRYGVPLGSPPDITFEVSGVNLSIPDHGQVVEHPTVIDSTSTSNDINDPIVTNPQAGSSDMSQTQHQQQGPHGGPQLVINKEERPFACEKCPKRFKDQKTLNGHKNVHSKELNFKCDVEDCQLAFKTSRLLQFHKKTLHEIAPGVAVYPCEHPDCNLVFKKRGQLKKHEVVHTGERRYVCEWPNCGKAFRHNANLKIHNLLHTGEKPISCGYCDFSCRQKSSLIHHMKTKHKEVEWPPAKGSIPTTPAKKTETPALIIDNQNTEDGFDDNTDLDTSRSDGDTSFDRSVETENTAVSEPPKQENITVYPKMLSTPTKAMVKAMAPGFRLNTPGFEKMKPVSPASSSVPLPASNKGIGDVYDFDDDDSSVPVLPKKGPVKSPGRQPVTSSTSIEPVLPAEPMNLSSENKPASDQKGAKKKKYSPKKKKVVEPKPENAKKTKGKSKVESAEEIITSIKETDSDSGVTSQESLDQVSSNSMVEEHVEENPPQLSSESGSTPGSVHPSDHEDMMEEPGELTVPSNPEPYPDPQPPTLHPENNVDSDTDSKDKHYNPASNCERRDSIEDSDIPADVQELALHRTMPPESPSLLAMHLEKRDSGSHNFELPHDIDPDEAAKLLEDSDSYQEKHQQGSHGVPVIMSNSQSNKDDYLPPSPSSHNNSLHQENDPRDITADHYSRYDSYPQPPSDYDRIQDLSSHEKEPETFTDPAQRRPSSSYVPDFLPTLASTSAGSSGMGPPSVSSNYSSPSYSVAAQNQADLSSYGAPGSNLPHYPPHSSSVPYLSPSSSHAPYPTSTSAGSGINSYPPITSTSYTESDAIDRVPSASDSRTYRDTDTTTVTSSSAYSGSAYSQSRDLFGHYLQDPNLSLQHISQQDPRSLSYTGQPSSLQALQRTSTDFFQRASATGLTGINYPSVTESLARLSQTGSQQPWIDERSRPWPQASPIIIPPELDSTNPLNRNPFSSARPEYSSLDSAKRADSVFSSQTVPGATDRYDSYMSGTVPFNPSTNYTKSLPPAPSKQLEEAYRHSATSHMTDYRALSQGAPSVTDMYRMGMNPPLGLDKYYGYPRDSMYRSHNISAAPNPFMPQTSSAQMPYADRDYAARNPYAQDTAYTKYLPTGNLGQPLPGLQGTPTDYFQARPGAPDPYDPYRRSVIHNMMTRYF